MKRIVLFLAILFIGSVSTACEFSDYMLERPPLSKIITWLKKHPGKDKSSCPCGRSLLATAINRNDIALVKHLIEVKKNNVHQLATSRKKPMLVYATSPDHVDLQITKLLIEKGVDVNQLSGNKTTALYAAMSSSRVDIVKYLLKHGADPLIGNKATRNAFASAMKYRKGIHLVELVKHLDGHPKYKAAYIAVTGAYNDLIAELKTKQAIKKWRGAYNVSLLQIAALAGNTELLKKLLPLIKYNYADKNKLRAIHFAAMGGQNDIIKLLLDAGEDIDCTCSKGMTPLMFAASGNHSKTIRLLAKRDVNLEAIDYFRCFSPLHWAAYYAANDAIKTLLELGVDINIRGDNLITALNVAYTRYFIEDIEATFQLLIDSGADIFAVDWFGDNRLEYEGLYSLQKIFKEAKYKQLKKALLNGKTHKAPTVEFEAVKRANPHSKTVVLLPVGDPSKKMIDELASNLKDILKIDILIDKDGLSRKTLKNDCGYKKRGLEDDRIFVEIMKRAGVKQKNIVIAGITEADLLSRGFWRFSLGSNNVFITSYRRLGKKYKPITVERVLKQLLARITTMYGIPRCGSKTCPRYKSINSAAALDKLDIQMCGECTAKFKRVFGHNPGVIKEDAPTEDNDNEEVF